jgi:hypothetical protein
MRYTLLWILKLADHITVCCADHPSLSGLLLAGLEAEIWQRMTSLQYNV